MRTKASHALLMAISLVGLCQSPQALAQPHNYSELIDEGIAEFKHGHWEEARALFQQAHEQQPSARTLRGLGIVEFELRHYAQSAHFLRAALKDERKPLTPALHSQVESLLARALAFVGRYTVELHPRTAALSVDGATRTLDSDGVLLLDAGEHRVAFTATGFGTQVRQLDVVGGEEEHFTVKLARLVAPDEEEASTSPAARPDADSADGRRRSRWLWITAVAVVAIAGGVTAGILASGRDDTADAYPGSSGVLLQGPEAAR